MSNILLYTSILSAVASASVCSVVAYWLHIRKIRKLMVFFNQTYQGILGVIKDDPKYTVKVKPVVSNNRPYDWETDEKFEEIVKFIITKPHDNQEPS